MAPGSNAKGVLSSKPAPTALPPTFRLEFTTHESLDREVSASLIKGRTFVAGLQGADLRQACCLELVHPDGATLKLSAEAVWVAPDAGGTGFELREWDEQQANQLVNWLRQRKAANDCQPEHAPQLGKSGSPPRPAEASVPRRRANIHDKIRGLNLVQQQALARSGSLPERVALERCYGTGVWEGLLQNPQLTAPEVAKIAKKGSLPKPLIQLILANAAWLGVPEVQRALLGNPRVSGAALQRVLRALSRRDLSRLPQQAGLRAAVRAEATKLLRNK